MKQIESNFSRGGFTFSLTKREGSVAMFTKTLSNKSDSPTWIEVVKLIEDEGQEVFPASTSWNILGFTFKGEQTSEAENQYDALCAEYNEETVLPTVNDAAPAEIADDDTDGSDSKYDDLDEEEKSDSKYDGFFKPSTPAVPVNSNNTPVVAKATPKVATPKVPSGKSRGRKRADIDFQVPKSGTFRAKDLAVKYNVSPPFVHNRLNELIEQGKVRVVERVPGLRGKPQKIMEWIS